LVRKPGKDGAVILTERDRDLFVSLVNFRYLSAAQVQRLHFASEQTTARRLRLLASAGYIELFTPTASAERLVALERKGAEVAADHLGVPFDELGWSAKREQPKDYLFLKHFLAASDFRIALTASCAARSDTRLLAYIPEHVADGGTGTTLQRHIRDLAVDAMDPKRKLSHTPDGVFALERNGTAALFFLEVDRGTEVLSHPERGVLKAIRFYLSLLVSGGYQRYQAEFGLAHPFRAFRTLFVMSSAERLRNMRGTCGTIAFNPEHAKRFIWLATDEVLGNATLLDREWVSLAPSDDSRYSLSGRSNIPASSI
jgi:hypothetical protein